MIIWLVVWMICPYVAGCYGWWFDQDWLSIVYDKYSGYDVMTIVGLIIEIIGYERILNIDGYQ